MKIILQKINTKKKIVWKIKPPKRNYNNEQVLKKIPTKKKNVRKNKTLQSLTISE